MKIKFLNQEFETDYVEVFWICCCVFLCVAFTSCAPFNMQENKLNHELHMKELELSHGK